MDKRGTSKLTRFIVPRSAFIVFLGLLCAPAAWAQQQPQQRIPRIGYVYPAGGKQGTSFQVLVGGQFLNGVSEVHISGAGVRAEILEYLRPLPPREAMVLRDRLTELQERKWAGALNGGKLGQASSTKPSTKAPWTAADEKELAEIKKKLEGFIRKPSSPAIAETVAVQITVERNAEPGRRELRLVMPGKLTNPLVFCIGELPEFSEAPAKSAGEPTKSVAREQMNITLPATENGQIMPGGVDRFYFQAHRGQNLVIIASARELVPYLPDAVPGWFQATLALFDSEGREVAYDDDYRFSPDPVLHYVVQRDGRYAIEIKDSIYRGREDFVYRISLGELPFITNVFPLGGPAGAETTVELKGWNLPRTRIAYDAREQSPGVYPLAVRKSVSMSNSMSFAVDDLPECFDQPRSTTQPAGPQPVALPIIVNGRISQPGEWDVFQFEGQAGDKIVAEVLARRLNSPLDSVLKLTDATDRQLAFNDDFEDKGSGLLTHHADSWLSATLPANGTYFLHLGDAQHQGGPEYAYRLRLGPPRPGFDLRAAPSGLIVRAGGAAMTVYALRRDGFAGEIILTLKDAPPGFRLSPDRVPAGQDQVKLTLTAPRQADEQPISLHLEGHATIDGKEMIRPVVPAEDMMQAFLYRHLVPAQELLVGVGGGWRFGDGPRRPTVPAGTQSGSGKGRANAK